MIRVLCAPALALAILLVLAGVGYGSVNRTEVRESCVALSTFIFGAETVGAQLRRSWTGEGASRVVKAIATAHADAKRLEQFDDFSIAAVTYPNGVVGVAIASRGCVIVTIAFYDATALAILQMAAEGALNLSEPPP